MRLHQPMDMWGRKRKRVDLTSAARVILLMMCCFTQAYAQFPSELWHEGKIVLLEGDTLKGLVKYDLPQNLVQYTTRDNRTEAFSARKVLFFEIYDASVRRYRQFFALPYMGMGTGADYKAPIFFELLTEGKMTVLCRESLETRMYSSSPYYGGGYYNNMSNYSRVVIVYTYYLLDENGNISEFTGNKSDLLQRMGKKSEEVEKYMKENRLRYDDRSDFVRIVAYYNSLM